MEEDAGRACAVFYKVTKMGTVWSGPELIKVTSCVPGIPTILGILKMLSDCEDKS